MTLCTIPTVGVRPQVRERRPGRPPSGKRLSMVARDMPAKVRSAFRRSLDPCDNSNDSGLGFDHHGDPHHHMNGMPDRVTWSAAERAAAEAKRPRLDIKVEHDDINDRYCFPETLRNCKDNSTALIRTAPAGSIPQLSMNNNQSSSSGRAVPRCIPLSNRQTSSSPIPLTSQLATTSRYLGDVGLTIVKQPEQQHRARYQTEGSRGAVKDREGNGFPIVQLNGYYQPTTLQVFIGTDVGKVSPHMFYQACKVSGKNSTPCVEKKIDGTCVIELQLDPSKEMSATCDCVGILKERNVDVEHRFPDQLGNRSKKKSTRCRMIFRTTLTHDDGTQETLQVCSQPIVCTQPPGVPEICKKSLTACPSTGGLELFVLGKNFLKDTKVYFQECADDRRVRWEQIVLPDKEYLQQSAMIAFLRPERSGSTATPLDKIQISTNRVAVLRERSSLRNATNASRSRVDFDIDSADMTHFVCVVPPFRSHDITEPITVRLFVMSSGKTSESHQFVYTPVNGASPSVHLDPPSTPQTPFFNKVCWPSSINKREQDLGMMPPPESSMVPMSTTRRPSISVPSTSEVHSPPLRTLKQEYIDENSQSSSFDAMDHQERYRHISESSLDVHHGDSNISMINDNSIDILNHNSIISHSENSNMSLSNDNSMDMMVRRNSIGARSMCGENSMDVQLGNSSQMSLNDDSCNAAIHGSNSVVTDRMVLAQSNLLQAVTQSSPSSTAALSNDELKVIDLRTKMPMATVSDLVCSNAPSLATLHRFGVTEASTEPLMAQSAQSVENFLTDIESKPINMPGGDVMQMKSSLYGPSKFSIQSQSCRNLLTTTVASSLSSQLSSAISVNGDSEPVFLSSQRPFLSRSTSNDAALHIAKSEAAAIAEVTMPEQTSTITAPTITTTLENGITSTINAEKLDALINSTVESHIGSPTRSANNKSPVAAADVMMTTKDVMLNSRANMLVPPMINTTLASLASEMQPHTSPNLSPEVILNSQISPSLMCRTSGGEMGPICGSQTPEGGLMPPITQQSLMSPTNQGQGSPNMQHSPIAQLVTSGEPERVVLLKAAVDLLETQKKLSELEHKQMETKDQTLMNMDDIISAVVSTTASADVLPPTSRLSQLSQAGNNFVQTQFSPPTTTRDNIVIPVPVKEMTTEKKQHEDRMIPQSFTSLTENELINLINPSCFDQGNANNYP